jgi:hypothetical protein
VRAVFWVADCQLPLLRLHGGHCLMSFYKDIDPIHEGSNLMT